ncbi:MAG: aminotransferase class III-fold pyridoxal phosphate-dependent enzyme [Thermoanaerobaculia bacterium]
MSQTGTETPAAAGLSATEDLYGRGKRRIPGGTQLLSKRAELFAPGQWPAYYSRAAGAEVWDLDDRKYLDMSMMGIGSCLLGYADPDVDEAVRDAIARGVMSTLNSPDEVELANLLCELHPWADMVRFGRCGGEAMAIAVRIARAHTRRDKIAFCGYHGWHDWYLAANLGEETSLDGHLIPGLEPAGVPRGLAGTALPFHYNKIDELRAIMAKNRGEIAAIVMEPVREHDPERGFLETVREIATESGAVLIFDEVTAGFRMNSGGIHLRFGVSPDIAVFAKGMSNGYAMAAVIGRSAVMESAQRSFISSTYWTERIGPAAALATIRKHQQRNVGELLIHTGDAVKGIWRRAAEASGLRVHVSGIAPLGHLGFDYPNGQAMATLYTQLMLERGFLATRGFYASYAHQPEHLALFESAVTEAFAILQKSSANGEVEKHLKGPVAHTGFQRLT